MDKKHAKGRFLTLLFSIISVLYVLPVVIILLNSFKKKAYISKTPFQLPTGKMFVGLENYTSGIEKTQFFSSLFWSVFITVGAVAVIILCTSMCAWYIIRSNSVFCRALYLLFVFSMIVPFQMVMFTLSKTADLLKLNTPWGIIIIYLGFGAGLAVFMFSGFVKGVPVEIEEAALIDGCSPIGTFFRIVLPILKPTCISVAILETMWIFNDYLLPYLVLDIRKYKTIPIAIQYLRGGYGSIDMGAMMAMLVLSIIPIIIFYLSLQKHIIKGVVAGAVKG
ncbi:MAG: carbohydrate ABC transporter permease [Ruminococcaceae bacterium]|nr:carbohydrate ABC transporter permease [Oscillospiraceae bacterium]